MQFLYIFLDLCARLPFKSPTNKGKKESWNIVLINKKKGITHMEMGGIEVSSYTFSCD